MERKKPRQVDVFQQVVASFVGRLLICHGFYILQRFHYRRKRYYDNRSDQLRNNVGGIVSQRIDHGIHALRRIRGKENIAGDNVADVAAKYTNDNTGGQTEFFLREKSGQSQCTEGQRVVKKYLQRSLDIGLNDQLQNTVGHTGHNTDLRTVQIADKAHEKHAEQGNGTAHGKTGNLDETGDQSQSHGYCAESQLFGAHFFVVFAGKYNGNHQSGYHQNDQNDITGCGQMIFPVFRVVS